VLFLAVIVGVGLVLPAGMIVLHSRQGYRARDEISAAFREKYPEIEFRGGMSAENPTVCVTIFGVDDRDKPREITQWLSEFKTTHRLGPEIRLTFGEKDLWNDPDVIWIK
jgi:hypothetical protein